MIECAGIQRKKYRTILADPPWAQSLTGKWNCRPNRAKKLPYETMNIEDIKKLPVSEIADVGCHLWLWTTNQFIKEGFEVMQSWGFKYLAPIHWIKPSGLGNWFIHRTQTILFGYKEKCEFNRERYFPNIIQTGIPKKHSQKPNESYLYIEKISDEPRVELFARENRTGWDSWGNEVESKSEVFDLMKTIGFNLTKNLENKTPHLDNLDKSGFSYGKEKTLEQVDKTGFAY